MSAAQRPTPASPAGPVLITGGAGFVGANLAHRLAGAGREVIVLDNLSRAGVEHNLQWLLEQHGSQVHFLRADIRDADAVARAVAQATTVFHFAAQVAVTTSLEQPREDFEINALGTLNVLEAARRAPRPPGVLMTSTNKVYGGLEDVQLERRGQRWMPTDAALGARGVDERRPLDFHSPYGCSKGTADQYVHDYARSFGLRTLVFRMSCIYGQRQFGTEDQGWVAHFLLRALRGEPITIYGDGCQVRDILHVDDLVDAFVLAESQLDTLSGRAFNIGGGPANTISLRDLLDRIEALTGQPVPVTQAAWRVGDQRYYVSDTRRFREASGWQPRVDAPAGIARLLQWLREWLDSAATAETADTEAEPALASGGAR